MRTTIRLADRPADDDQPPAGESGQERHDREHEQLFHELRSIIPGVQIQGAFLLTVAFTQRFERLNDFQRDVYYVTFLLAAAGLVLLLAPPAFHRVQFRRHDKEMMMRAANVEVIAALVLVSLSLAGTLLLITDLIFPVGIAITAAVVTLVVTSLLWWVFPIARRFRGQ
jgi:presenilin-like A22 family membrane protease